MTAVCNGTDLSALIGYGYTHVQEPQYGGQVTAIDGTDYSAKLRDRVRLTVPFIALTRDQLTAVLALFPQGDAYVTWTFFDPYLGENRTAQMKYEDRSQSLKVRYKNGVEYWDGLVVQLTER